MSTTKWRRVLVDNAMGLYIFGVVALGVVVAGSVALEGGITRLAAAVMRQGGDEASWRPAVRAVDAALASGDLTGASLAWSDAQRAAQVSRRWEAHLAVGHLRVKIDQAARAETLTPASARDSYLAALWRARQEGSLEGILQSAEAFGSLGDAQVAGEALRIAEAVAGRDPSSAVLARLTSLREAWGDPRRTGLREQESLLVEP